MALQEPIAYDKRELRDIVKVMRTISDESQQKARDAISKLTDKELTAIRNAASTRTKANKVAMRVAEGGRAKKSSLLGEITFGMASQRFSGGADTRFSTRGEKPKKGIGGGIEFGSNKFKQFPDWSGRASGGGSRGWFIYPTIRSMQKEVKIGRAHV